jgi:osmotically-inducible protein OsmY
VVFLEGSAPSEQVRTRAGDLARNTQDVVAVVNRITVAQASMWDFGPARRGFATLRQDALARFRRWRSG